MGISVLKISCQFYIYIKYRVVELNLELMKPSYNNNQKINYLDVINIEIENKKLITGVYDKNEDFNYKTMAVLYFESNVHI